MKLDQKKDEIIYLGTSKICGKGETLLIHISKKDTEGNGLQQGELVEVTLKRLGKIIPKRNITGNPALQKK